MRGAAAAKRAWTERNMIEDVSAGLSAVKVPVTVVIGDRDQVEREPPLRNTFARFLPHATVRVLKDIGHLSPLEAPHELADACTALLKVSDDATHTSVGDASGSRSRPVIAHLP